MSYLAMREDRGESFRLKGERERERRTKHVSSPFARERRIKWIKSDREKETDRASGGAADESGLPHWAVGRGIASVLPSSSCCRARYLQMDRLRD